LQRAAFGRGMEAPMTERESVLDPYLAEHVREALAQDPRLGELHVDVQVAGESVVLTGTLPTVERQEAAAEVARDLLPDREIRNETVVSDFPESPDVEHLP
jgi:osmotically-inducible protein OsmY